MQRASHRRGVGMYVAFRCERDTISSVLRVCPYHPSWSPRGPPTSTRMRSKTISWRRAGPAGNNTAKHPRPTSLDSIQLTFPFCAALAESISRLGRRVRGMPRACLRVHCPECQGAPQRGQGRWLRRPSSLLLFLACCRDLVVERRRLGRVWRLRAMGLGARE